MGERAASAAAHAPLAAHLRQLADRSPGGSPAEAAARLLQGGAPRLATLADQLDLDVADVEHVVDAFVAANSAREAEADARAAVATPRPPFVLGAPPTAAAPAPAS